mgnify:CR=1 FL=1
MAKRRKQSSIQEWGEALSPSIRLERRTIWRKGGRFSKPRVKGARATTYLFQVSPRTGRLLRAVEVLTKQTILKTMLPGFLDDPRRPEAAGMLLDGLRKTNILGDLRYYRDQVGRITVRVSGKDPDGKRRTVKLDLVPPEAERKRLGDYLIGAVMGAMRRAGLRTQYDLQIVDWAKVREHPIKRRGAPIPGRPGQYGTVIMNSKTQVAARKELSGVEVRVEVERRPKWR